MKTCIARMFAAFIVVCTAFPASGQGIVSDPFTEKGLKVKDYRLTDNTYIVELTEHLYEAEKLKALVISSSEHFKERLVDRDACGKHLDGDPEGTDPDQVCAIKVDIYQNAEGEWRANVMPIFALKATSIGRLIRPEDREALAISAKGRLGIVKFTDLLPKKGDELDGYVYDFTFVIGEAQNQKEGFGLPEGYFDPKHYNALRR